MNLPDFTYLAGVLKDRSGLIVTPDKTYLFETRLGPVARKHGHGDVCALITAMRAGRNEALIGEVVDAMTTNETSFFRDRYPFEAMRTAILPDLIRRRAPQRSLRIWSAACSTGQEAFSLAMMLREHFPTLSEWKVEIVGTDISPTVLVRAREGAFSTFEVQRGLPAQYLVRHFTQDGDRWLLKPEIRNRVTFRLFNLLTDMSALGTFDVIFCRNVLIYFDLPAKALVLEGLHGRLAPDGALILGGSESVFGISRKFTDRGGLRGVYAPVSAKDANQSMTPARHAAGSRATAVK